jgi:hypothetical protein
MGLRSGGRENPLSLKSSTHARLPLFSRVRTTWSLRCRKALSEGPVKF